MKRPAIAGLLLAAALSSAHAGPDIQWGVTISSGMPPPVRYEPMPPPRGGYVWVEGYWNWNGGAYVWVPGHWLRARTGYVYAQPRWQEGPRGWELHRGRWQRGGHGHHDHDDRGYRERDGHGDHGGPGHCPPGQRKKGHC